MNGHRSNLPGFLNNHLMLVSKHVFDQLHLNNLPAVILLVGLVACSQTPAPSMLTLPTPPVSPTGQPTVGFGEITPTPTLLPSPTRLLTICLGREPTSLFYYDAASTASQDILAAVYDGPVDIQNYTEHAVILEKLPALIDGDARLQPVQVNAGDLIVDSAGNPVNLESGVAYRPSGCTEVTCTQSYSGDQPITMDQLVLDFKLLPGITWSDGAPLTSADSVYSYELARSLYPSAHAELIIRTQSYKASDDTSTQWIGIPGYQDGIYRNKFYTPLPQHAWHTYSVEELRSADISARQPLGWGAYVIDQWVSGDHISLHKNPLYFRAGEKLPRFDNLVFRFVGSTGEALDALQAGECDVIDQTAMFDLQTPRLSELLNSNQAQAFYQNDAGWEQITFGINSIDSQKVKFFELKEVRQAVAMCINRQALVADQLMNIRLLLDSYVSPSHPLYNSQVVTYDLDLQKAADLLESVGWLDADHDPTTPRTAQGVAGVLDGTAFEVEYLVSSDARPQSDALAIQKMLAECGIGTRIVTQQPQDFLAPGPEGPVFGRAFDMAQFAWAGSFEPACNLYVTSEITGPYPEFSKGWGGMNASGYSNPQYDAACENALFSLSDAPQHRLEHLQAQDIFSAELPALPLYLHTNVSVARSDLCNYTSASAVDTPLWFLELLDYGSGCS
jgi:peptide/nickel transport system substrate-binding protein